MRRLTYKEVKKYIESFNYKLLSTKYNNCSEKLKLECNKGHEYNVSYDKFKQGGRCPECLKLTYEFVKGQIEKEGYKLLSTEYKNSKAKLKVQCLHNHTYYTTYSRFKQGGRCPKCNRISQCLSMKDVKKYIESFNYKLLSKEYKNVKEKLKLQCPKGHIYYGDYNHFQQGRRCPECLKITYKIIKNFIESKGYELLSKEYINNTTKLIVKCNKNHIYKTTWSDFNFGIRCLECHRLSQCSDIKDVKKYIESFGYKLLSTKYKNAYGKLKIQCPKDHIYKSTWVNFQQGHRCIECTKRNYTEEELKEFKMYRENIVQISNQNFRKCYYKINPKKLKRSFKNYHLDHVYSIANGFKNNIPVEVISNPNNLQMLWWFDNLSKKDKSDQTKQELYLGYYRFILEENND